MMEGGTISNHSLWSCSIADLRWVADQLGHDWRKIGCALGIRPPEIERLEENYPRQVEEQIFQMLVSYRQKHGSKTYSGLYNAFNKCGRRDIADGFETRMKQCQQMQNIPNSSPNELPNQQIIDTSSIEFDSEEPSGDFFTGNSHNSRCMLREEKPRRRKSSSSRSRSKHSKDRHSLSAIPTDLDFRFLKDDIAEAITPKDLDRLKRVVKADKKQGIHCGIEAAQLLNIKTADNFLRSLEEQNLFGEDNLYYVQFLMHKLKKQDILESINEYAQKRSSQPIVLAKIKRHRPGRGRTFVEFRIKGNVRHFKFKDVNKFKKVISKSLNIPLRYINLAGSGSGSVILVFQIPDTGVERLRNSLERKDVWLQENDVLDVHINREDCVHIQREHSQIIQSVHTDDRSSYVEESVSVGNGFETPDDIKKDKNQKRQTVAEEEPNDTKRIKISSKEKASISIVEPHQSIPGPVQTVSMRPDMGKSYAFHDVSKEREKCGRLETDESQPETDGQSFLDNDWEDNRRSHDSFHSSKEEPTERSEMNNSQTGIEDQSSFLDNAGPDEGINVNMRPDRGKSNYAFHATKEQEPTVVTEGDDAHPKGVQINSDDDCHQQEVPYEPIRPRSRLLCESLVSPVWILMTRSLKDSAHHGNSPSWTPSWLSTTFVILKLLHCLELRFEMQQEDTHYGRLHKAMFEECMKRLEQREEVYQMVEWLKKRLHCLQRLQCLEIMQLIVEEEQAYQKAVKARNKLMIQRKTSHVEGMIDHLREPIKHVDYFGHSSREILGRTVKLQLRGCQIRQTKDAEKSCWVLKTNGTKPNQRRIGEEWRRCQIRETEEAEAVMDKWVPMSHVCGQNQTDAVRRGCQIKEIEEESGTISKTGGMNEMRNIIRGIIISPLDFRISMHLGTSQVWAHLQSQHGRCQIREMMESVWGLWGQDDIRPLLSEIRKNAELKVHQQFTTMPGRKGGSSAAAKRVKANHRKGAAFEKKVATAVKRSSGIKTLSVKTQVLTKRHSRADVVAKTKSGKKIVIEAKNFYRNPVTKANVKQVCRYGKDLHAKPKLVVSKSTTVLASTKKYAAQGGVSIMKL